MGALLGCLMSATTAVATVLAYRMWLKVADGIWTKRQVHAARYADQPMAEPFALIDLLPRNGRQLVKPVAVWLPTLFLGGVHFLLILTVFLGDGGMGPWRPPHYVWTLAIWLAVLAIPALMTAQHRVAVRKAATADRAPA